MQCSICPPWARMTRVSRCENWSMAVSTKSSSSSLVWRSPFPVTLQRIFSTCLKQFSLVVFCCNFWTLQQKLHDYICTGCKNMVSQKCAVFIGPPCTSIVWLGWLLLVSVYKPLLLLLCLSVAVITRCYGGCSVALQSTTPAPIDRRCNKLQSSCSRVSADYCTPCPTLRAASTTWLKTHRWTSNNSCNQNNLDAATVFLQGV